jgi:hypothetical protein
MIGQEPGGPDKIEDIDRICIGHPTGPPIGAFGVIVAESDP